MPKIIFTKFENKFNRTINSKKKEEHSWASKMPRNKKSSLEIPTNLSVSGKF